MRRTRAFLATTLCLLEWENSGFEDSEVVIFAASGLEQIAAVRSRAAERFSCYLYGLFRADSDGLEGSEGAISAALGLKQLAAVRLRVGERSNRHRFSFVSMARDEFRMNEGLMFAASRLANVAGGSEHSETASLADNHYYCNPCESCKDCFSNTNIGPSQLNISPSA